MTESAPQTSNEYDCRGSVGATRCACIGLITPVVRKVSGRRAKGSSRLLGWALVFALLIMPWAVGRGTAQTTAPTWQVGEYWTYRTYSSYPGAPNATGSQSIQVVADETLKAGTRNYTAYRLLVQEALTGAPWADSYNEWRNTSDLGLLMELRILGNETSTETYAPPLSLHWPLAANATWTSAGNLTVSTQYAGSPSQSYTIPYSMPFRVEPSRSITVPAGTFDVIPILQGNSSNGVMQYWSPSVANYIRVESLQGGQTTLRADLLAYGHRVAPAGELGLLWWVAAGTVGTLGLCVAVAVRRKRRLGPLRGGTEQGGRSKVPAPPRK